MLFARLFKFLGFVTKEEAEGIQLDTSQAYWEVQGPDTFADLFEGLVGFFAEDAVLYFEGGSPSAEIGSFVARHAIPEEAHLALGTIWPRPKVFHVPAKKTIITELAKIMKHHAEPELAIHFHVYRNGKVLLEWHDAFDQPLLIAGSIPEKKVAALAQKFGTSHEILLRERG